MNKFEAGDKVRCIIGGDDLTVGKIYEVIRIDESGDLCLVDDSGDEWVRWASKFMFVESTTKSIEKSTSSDNFIELDNLDGLIKHLGLDNIWAKVSGHYFKVDGVSIEDKCIYDSESRDYDDIEKLYLGDPKSIIDKEKVESELEELLSRQRELEDLICDKRKELGGLL